MCASAAACRLVHAGMCSAASSQGAQVQVQGAAVSRAQAHAPREVQRSHGPLIGLLCLFVGAARACACLPM